MTSLTPPASPARVSLEEFAGLLGFPEWPMFLKLGSLGYHLADDWAGRPSLTAAEAAEAFLRISTEVREDRDRQLREQAEAEAAARRLVELEQSAFREEYERELRAGRSNASAWVKGRQAIAALRRRLAGGNEGEEVL